MNEIITDPWTVPLAQWTLGTILSALAQGYAVVFGGMYVYASFK